MAKYAGKPSEIHAPVGEVYGKISDLSTFQARVDALPPEARAKLGDVRFTTDSIVINAPGVGEMMFTITERRPETYIKMEAGNSPVPFAIVIELVPKSADITEARTWLEVDIPPMLKPMVGGKLQAAATQFGDLFGTLFG